MLAKTTTTTTITSDPGILCFHHCNVKVFCFKLPHICPNCKVELDNVEATTTTTTTRTEDKTSNGTTTNNGYICLSKKLLPFRLPYPFVRATQYPCAIVLRPTVGDFLNDYNNATDLHIAVTTSTGCIVEFDRNGLRRHQRAAAADSMPEWWQCLLVGDVPEAWYDYWDEILFEICNQPNRWSIASYHEDTHNCYTFVLAFLQALGYDKLSAAAQSKTTFCERYIVPRTTTAGKYISLYRKLRVAGIYVHHQHQHHSHQQQQQKQQQQTHQQHCNAKMRLPNVNGTIASTIATATAKAPATTTNYSKSSSPHSIITRAHTLCTIEE